MSLLPIDRTKAMPAPQMGVWGRWRRLARRRRYVVDPRYQMRSGAWTASVAMALLLLLNVSLLLTRTPSSASAVRQESDMRFVLQSEGGLQLGILIVGSLVFLGGVFLVGVVESHRTAGAAIAIRRGLDSVRDGKLGARVQLRRGDHLQTVASAFNGMAGHLRERAGEEAECLEGVASRAEAFGARDVALELRRLADEKRNTLT